MDIRNLYEDAMNHLNSMSDEEFREISERAREDPSTLIFWTIPMRISSLSRLETTRLLQRFPMFLQKFQMNCGSILEIRTIESFRVFVL